MQYRRASVAQMYLHELEATAGTVKQPPRLAALLASKACRSAVMFGEALSNEQSATLVSKLRRTRRFDICAHGRPTLAPLLDLGRFEAMRASSASR
jgi:DNA mismatch repair protein MLH3